MLNIIRALCANFIRALCVIFFFGLLTACGGGGNSASAPMQMTMPTVANPNPTPAQIAQVERLAGDGVTREELYRILLENNIAQREFFVQYLQNLGQLLQPRTILVTVTQPPLTVTTTAGVEILPITVITTPATATTRIATPMVTIPAPPRVTTILITTATPIERCIVSLHGSCLQTTVIVVTATSFLPMTITVGNPAYASYTPQMARVVVAAMSDGFRRGVIVGESALSFSGRYDGDNRAAGFAYDFGNFQMRTDYIRLPSKQDGEVWLDTYRLGIIRPINDETRIFAGVDSYDNAIMAIDINTKSDIKHRLGAAMAKGNKEYAIQYELRLNL